jgi:hypothetical protein
MTQPRKEQINDRRSYSTRIDSYGVTTPILMGTPDVPGGTVQTIANTIAENYYNEFLALTVTGTPGGAESDTPAYFFGLSGPFSPPVAAGATFTITLPNVNSGNPVAITFQPSDVVNISGTPYITTSKAAIRINAALTAAGVSPSSPVAQNINGQLVLASAGPSGYTTGETAFITVNDLTVGMCAALGFTSGSNATALGISSPQRGIITTSGIPTSGGYNAGFGGYVQFQLTDGSPAITKSNTLINVSGLGNVPLYPAGQAIYGRLQQFTNTSGTSKFTISYVRQGAVPAKIVTNGGSFSPPNGLNVGDSFSVTVNTTNPIWPYAEVQSYNFTVSFGSAPTGPASVIAAVNAQWNLVAVSNGLGAGVEAGRGGVISGTAGPWQFNAEDQFWIVFDGQTNRPVPVQPGLYTPPGSSTPGLLTASQLATYITTQIATFATSPGSGIAAVANSSLAPGCIQITSGSTGGPTSTVQIIPGDPADVVPVSPPVVPPTPYLDGVNSSTLDKLGISPGIYAGTVIASLYGNDEIQFVCPDHTVADPYGTPSSISITASASVMGKLGLGSPIPNPYTVSTDIGFEPVSPPNLHALIPEMMYFGEVPENVSTTIDTFLATDEPAPALPSGGVGNAGTAALFGPDGKISPNLVRKIFDQLNIGQLVLGAENTGNNLGNALPRILTPLQDTASLGLTLLWEAPSVAGVLGGVQIMRVYADGQGGLWLTCNANSPSAATPIQWTKDVAGESASAAYLGQSTVSGVPKFELLYAGAAVSSPFAFSGAPDGLTPPVGFDPSGALGGALAFITAGTTSTTSNENLLPRFQAQVAANTYTLIWQTRFGTSVEENIRIYSLVTTSSQTEYWLTINAYWGGVSWSRDVHNVNAYALQLQTGNNPGSPPTGIGVQTGLFLYYRAPTDSDGWAAWTPNGGLSGPNSFLTMGITGQNGGPNGTGGILQVNNIRLGELIPPLGISDLNARISVPNRPLSGTRILVAEYGTTPQGSVFLEAAGGPGPATLSAVLGGPNANLSTLTGLVGMNATMQGMYLTVEGAAVGSNNGTFQIVNILSATSVQIINSAGVLPDANSTILTYALGGMGQIGGVMRMYVGSNFQGSEGFGAQNYSFVMLTCNARWTGSNWQCDFPTSATMQLWTGNSNAQGTNGDTVGFTQFFTWIPSGYGISWGDDNWLPLASFGINGIQLPAQESTTYNIQGIPNLINPANIPKAWGSVAYQNTGSGASQIWLGDSWNVFSYSIASAAADNYNAGALLINLYAPIVSTGNGGFGPAPSATTVVNPIGAFSSMIGNPIFCSAVAVSSTQIAVNFYDHTGAIINVSSTASTVGCCFAVFGRQ